MMQVDDCDDSPLGEAPIPESGRFVNPRLTNEPESDPRRPLTEPDPPRTLTQRVYRFLERVRFIVPVSRRSAPDDDRPSSAYRRPSTR
jgi:hypothetical protein